MINNVKSEVTTFVYKANKNIPLRYKKENYKLNAPFGCKTILHYCFIYQNGIFTDKMP